MFLLSMMLGINIIITDMFTTKIPLMKNITPMIVIKITPLSAPSKSRQMLSTKMLSWPPTWKSSFTQTKTKKKRKKLTPDLKKC